MGALRPQSGWDALCKVPCYHCYCGMFIPSGLELQWKQESSLRGALGAVSRVLTPHYGDETPKSRAQIPGPHFSWEKVGTPTVVKRTPLPASPPEGSLPHLPSLRGSLGPLDRDSCPWQSRVWGCRATLREVQLTRAGSTRAPLGVQRLPGKKLMTGFHQQA